MIQCRFLGLLFLILGRAYSLDAMEIHQHPAMINNKITLKRVKKSEQEFVLGDEGKLEIEMPTVKLDAPPTPPTYTIPQSDILFSPDGYLIVVNEPRQGLFIFDAQSGTQKAHLEKTEKDVFEKIMWSKLGTYIASVSRPVMSEPGINSTFRLWDVRKNKLELERKTTGFLIEFSSKDNYMALDSENASKIDVISLADKKWRGSLQFLNNSITFSPDERFLAYYGKGTGNSEFEIIEMATGKTIAKIPGSTLAFSPDCKHIIAYNGSSYAIHLYNAETFAHIKKSKITPSPTRYGYPLMQFIRFSSDGTHFLLRTNHGDEEEMNSTDLVWEKKLNPQEEIFPELTKALVLKQHQLLIHLLSKPFETRKTYAANFSPSPFECLADAQISPDEKYVLGLISSQKVFLYNLQRYKTKILGYARTLERFQFSPNSKHLARISTDKTEVWNLD